MSLRFLSGANIADKTITTDPRIIAITQNVDFLRSTVLSLYEGIIRPYLYFSNEEVNKIFKNDSSKSKFVFIHALNLHDYAYDKKV
ncbi:hypothetical protein Bealeia1_00189 [Candidatus Bealeia paramacronuclearis]|uniref:Uncharacterized protein n=1 Tax=Candidatus Bealeia paramacronuclearis TaxID=1921001 RepID=A0ABZ2C0G3_9PROT